MRLIFFIDNASTNGGMIQSVLALVKKLAELEKYEIILICVPGTNLDDWKIHKSVRIIVTSFEWVLSMNIPKVLITSYKLYRVVKPYLKKSVLLTNDVGQSFLVSMFPICKKRELYINRGGRFERPIGRYTLLRIKLHRMLWVSTTSSFQTNLINKLCGRDLDYISTISDGLPIPTVYNNIQNPLNNGILNLSIVGYIAELKNQIVGIRLIMILKERGINAVLNIFGTATTTSDINYNVFLQTEISKYGLENNVHFHGFSNHYTIFSQTDILLSTSKAEGFGRTLVEGMLWKKPIIAFRGAGGPIDITNDGEYGYLVDECTPEAYCEVIMEILNKPNKTQNKVEASYKYAVSHFTEDIMTEKYDLLLEKLKKELD